jgi:hypothetical protein
MISLIRANDIATIVCSVYYVLHWGLHRDVANKSHARNQSHDQVHSTLEKIKFNWSSWLQRIKSVESIASLRAKKIRWEVLASYGHVHPINRSGQEWSEPETINVRLRGKPLSPRNEQDDGTDECVISWQLQNDFQLYLAKMRKNRNWTGSTSEA